MKIDSGGDLLIAYSNTAGGNAQNGTICRYDTDSRNVKELPLPDDLPVGDVVCDRSDPNRLFACTRGLWWGQKWSTVNSANGDAFYSSMDGGATWKYLGIDSENPLTNNGCTWILDKSIHWAGCLAINPDKSGQVFVISGNGVFSSDNMWGSKPDFYFNGNGIEETVCLDLLSIPGDSLFYSCIGDYDGFVHDDPETPAKQFQPTMGTTGDLSYAPAKPAVMVRVASSGNLAYYSENAAKTWKQLGNPLNFSGGISAATVADGGKVRIFRSPWRSGKLYYTDDYGKSWTTSQNIGEVGTMDVDSTDPNRIYACTRGNFYYSTDCGKSFQKTSVQCSGSRIIHAPGVAGKVYVPGTDGMLYTKDGGKTFGQLNTVSYCGAVGVGKEKDASSPLTLYIWGTVGRDTGLFYSTDDGKSWCMLTDEAHQFGGMGNGNFVTGDMNTFGTVYFPTVGLGIECHRFANGGMTDEPVNRNGDINQDGKTDHADVTALQKYLSAESASLADWQADEHSNIGTIGAALGFALMMILDVALG